MRHLIIVAVLLADLWALSSVLGARADTARKLGWTVIIVALPIVGFLIWLWRGPKRATTRSEVR